MELGYALAEEHWGQGIMTEVAAAVVEYCFKEFGLKRIQSRCKAEHNGSRRVMEKIGMTYEGTLKAQVYHRQQYWDMHYYSLIKD
jgi:ribosomal-protein-alanine N-acetyltransferase